MKNHIHKILVIMIADNDVAIVPVFLISAWKSLINGNFYQTKGCMDRQPRVHTPKHLCNTTLQEHADDPQGWADGGQDIQTLLQGLDISDCVTKPPTHEARDKGNTRVIDQQKFIIIMLAWLSPHIQHTVSYWTKSPKYLMAQSTKTFDILLHFLLVTLFLVIELCLQVTQWLINIL